MDMGKNIQQSFDLYFKNFVTLLVAGLIAGLLSMVTLGILAGPLVGGLLVLGLKLLRGEKGEFNEIFAHFDQFLPTFLLTLLFLGVNLVLGIIGAIPLIGWAIKLVAGPLAVLAYFLSIGFMIDQKIKLKEAVRKSVDCIAADPVMMWIYSLVMMILGGIGMVIIVGAAFGVMGMAVAYRELAVKETPSFKPEKKALQIAGVTVAVLVVIGLACMAFGGYLMHRSGSNFAAKIISGMTGQKVKIDSKNDEIVNMKIGDMSFGSGLPDNFPKDVPLYPKAKIGGYLGGKDGKLSGSTTTFTSDDSVTDIYNFYTDKLAKRGWAITTPS
jgi:hypothetical protein